MSKADFLKANANSDTHLKVTSIFLTVDGETNAFHAGTWTVFIRLQGCRVGCHWCDTKYTWDPRKGQLMDAGEIANAVRAFGVNKVTITGGEPLEQYGDQFRALLLLLYGMSMNVSMETAGTEVAILDIIKDYPEVNIIMDYKLASANTVKPTYLRGFEYLRWNDVVKIVATVQEIGLVAATVRMLRKNGCVARMVLSPLWSMNKDLPLFIEGMIKYQLPQLDVGFSLQTHKFIWPDNVRDEEGLTSGVIKELT